MTSRTLKDDTFSNLTVNNLNVTGNLTQGTVSTSTFIASSTYFVNSTDNTKRLVFNVNNSTGVTTTITTTSTANRTYTIPDGGSSGEFIMQYGAQNVFGTKTFTSPITITPATNQLTLGPSANNITLNAVTPASSRVYTLPDSGANASFVMSEGTQTINGSKTFSSASTFTAGATTPIAAGFTYTGTTTASAAAATVALNSKVGTATFTGQTCAGNSTLTLTVTNTSAGTNGIVSFTCSQAATVASGLYIQSVTWTANTSVVVVIGNNTATTTGAVDWKISFVSFT